MLKMIIAKMIAKYGMKGLLVKIGDIAVKVTKSKKDDEVWTKVKKVLDKV